LPEAQLDRFLLNVYMDYLPKEDEASMVASTTSLKRERPQAVFSGEEIIELQKLTRQVPVAMEVVHYAVNLASATRPTLADASPLAKEKIKWGAGSRASQALVLAAKARALLEGRYTVAMEDVQALALPVLRHRIIPSFNAVAEGVTSKEIIEELLELVKA
jgi:MoxR-like ATPase